jgi:H/ACA ribonucleoprotein complex subunit 4
MVKSLKELISFGILLVDKPQGWTSFDVVNHIRKSLKLKKAGHLGTLDPNVTGVLPIVLEEACKIQELFMHRDKTYVGKMKFHAEIEKDKIEEGIKKFIGRIKQLPPVKSRVKRVVREREIKIFEITGFDKDKREASFIAEVEAGTYIRKLVSDLGEFLGINCQMTELRRIKAGLFSDKDKEFLKIEEFDKAIKELNEGKEEKLKDIVISAEKILKLIDSYEIKSEFVQKLKNGSPLFSEMLQNQEDKIEILNSKEVFALTCNKKIIELAKTTNQFENKSIIAKPWKVLNY